MTETAQVLEARPTSKQARAMRKQFDISRVGYNDVLGRLVDFAGNGQIGNVRDLRKDYNAEKFSIYEKWYKKGGIHSATAERDSIENLAHAWDRFQKWAFGICVAETDKHYAKKFFEEWLCNFLITCGLYDKDGNENDERTRKKAILSIKNFPKFKRKDTHEKYSAAGTRTESHGNLVSKDGNLVSKDGKWFVKLPKVGLVRLKRVRYEMQPKGIKVKARMGKWFVTLTHEADIEKPPVKKGMKVGIDLALKEVEDGESNTIVMSTGKRFRFQKPMKKHAQRLAFLQRKLSIKLDKQKKLGVKRRSKRAKKAQEKLNKFHDYIARCRADQIHKITSRISKLPNIKTIRVGEDSVKNMSANPNHKNRKKPLNRSFMDCALSETRRHLKYKLPREGKSYVGVDPAGTSKTCNRCGSKTDLTMSIRSWTCDGCGQVHYRDRNAAINTANKPESKKSLKEKAVIAKAKKKGDKRRKKAASKKNLKPCGSHGLAANNSGKENGVKAYDCLKTPPSKETSGTVGEVAVDASPESQKNSTRIKVEGSGGAKNPGTSRTSKCLDNSANSVSQAKQIEMFSVESINLSKTCP